MKTTHEQSGIHGQFRIITTRGGVIVRQTPWQKNLIMLGDDTGKDLILDRLAGTNTYSLNITHADMGTGTNIPTASDTQLQTAVARAQKALGNISSNMLSLRFFFTDAILPDDTYTEFGTFVDGSAGVDTGQIFNRALFGIAYEKAGGEDTTIEVQFTII